MQGLGSGLNLIKIYYLKFSIRSPFRKNFNILKGEGVMKKISEKFGQRLFYIGLFNKYYHVNGRHFVQKVVTTIMRIL